MRKGVTVFVVINVQLSTVEFDARISHIAAGHVTTEPVRPARNGMPLADVCRHAHALAI